MEEIPQLTDSDRTIDEMPCLGIMLPSGISIRNPNSSEGLQREIFQRLNKIEKAFGEYFLLPINQRFSLAYQENMEVDMRD